MILWLDSQPVQDFNTMYSAATQLAAGDFSYLENLYFFNWAYQSAFVAYEALVIRLFGTSLLPLQLLNALWLGGIALMVYKIGRTFLSEKLAQTAALFYSVYPAPLALAGVLTNQHLATFLFLSAFYLCVKEKNLSIYRALAAGALIAVGNAIRPVGIILLLALGLFLILKLLQGHLNSKTALLPLIALVVGCQLVFSLLSFSITASGINPQGLSNNQPMWKFAVGLNQESNGCWNQEDYENFLSLPTQEADEAMRQAVKERLGAGPTALGKLAVRKSAIMWGACEDLYWGFGHIDGAARFGPISWNSLQLLISRLDKGVYLTAFSLALVGILSALVRKQWQTGTPLLLAILFCGYYAVHLIVEVQSRYRYFIMPAIFLLAAWGLGELAALHSNSNGKKRKE